MASVKGCNILGSWCVLGKRDKYKDLSSLGKKGQIELSKQLGQSISTIVGLVSCSWYAVVKYLPRVAQGRAMQELATGSWGLKTHWRATVALIAEKVNASCDRKVSEHTVYRILQCKRWCCSRPVRVGMLTHVYC